MIQINWPSFLLGILSSSANPTPNTLEPGEASRKIFVGSKNGLSQATFLTFPSLSSSLDQLCAHSLVSAGFCHLPFAHFLVSIQPWGQKECQKL